MKVGGRRGSSKPAASTNTTEASGKQPASSSAAPVGANNRRLMAEYKRLVKNPIDFIEAHPSETNFLEWHFCLSGSQAPYLGGKYHGILEFPEDFPMKPPRIKMLTPSGRFEINKRVCLSMSDYHAESWNPSWTVEKILIGLMSFMYEESTESIGSMLDTVANRKRMAEESQLFNMQNETYVQLFGGGEDGEGKKEAAEDGDNSNDDQHAEVDREMDDDDEDVCRFCLCPATASNPLVNPCECKGSGKWVHMECLRQWQKSVLMTQSTHPMYQSSIDEVCNICKKKFKNEYKPKSRRQQMMEWTGQELHGVIRKGNLIVPNRTESDKSKETMEK